MSKAEDSPVFVAKVKAIEGFLQYAVRRERDVQRDILDAFRRISRAVEREGPESRRAGATFANLITLIDVLNDLVFP